MIGGFRQTGGSPRAQVPALVHSVGYVLAAGHRGACAVSAGLAFSAPVSHCGPRRGWRPGIARCSHYAPGSNIAWPEARVTQMKLRRQRGSFSGL